MVEEVVLARAFPDEMRAALLATPQILAER
jgi:hypothetical protein